MTTRDWPYPPGTCRAVAVVHGPQVVVCDPCRRYTAMPSIDVPFDPCPFVCRRCGRRGRLVDAAEAPAGYAHESRTAGGPAFLPPKLRPKATR